MKKTILIVASLIGSMAFAKAHHETKVYSRPYGAAGCGLGSAVIGKHDGQIFAATTNGTSYNQLFGITSGTLNCVDDSVNAVALRSDNFINANRFALESDVARGQGEALAGLSKVLGCHSQSALGSVLQKSYSDVFVSGAVTNEITDSIITVIINDQELKAQCTLS